MNFWKKNLKIVKLKLKEFKMKPKNLKLIARTEEDLKSSISTPYKTLLQALLI